MRVPILATIVLAACVAVEASVPARWERRAPMSVPRQEVGAAAVGHVVYTIGGYAGSDPSPALEAYDTQADRWTPRAPLPAALHHVMAATVDGIVYAVGGLGTLDATGAADSTFAYDPVADAWTSRARLPRPRGAGAAAVIGGRVYVAGGLRGVTSVDDFAVYDPVADTWTELPPMPTARDHLAAAAIDGRLYVVGGRANGTNYDVLEVFDPADGAWSRDRTPMPTARGGLGGTALGGLLYAFGGEGNADSPAGTFPQAEAYDPARDAWTTLPDMGVPRHGIGVAAVDGAIYVVGGATRQGLGPSGASEVFFPRVGDVLTIARIRGVRPTGLRLRGTLLAADDVDPGSSSLAVRVEHDAGTVIDVAFPPGSLRAFGRRWRLARIPRTAGARVTRLTLRRTNEGELAVRLGVRARPLPAAGTTLVVALTLGERRFDGAAALRARRPSP